MSRSVLISLHSYSQLEAGISDTFGEQHEEKTRTPKEENLGDLCESGDGVADVVVDVQPGRRSPWLLWGVWRGCGQETCDP